MRVLDREVRTKRCVVRDLADDFELAVGCRLRHVVLVPRLCPQPALKLKHLSLRTEAACGESDA